MYLSTAEPPLQLLHTPVGAAPTVLPIATSLVADHLALPYDPADVARTAELDAFQTAAIAAIEAWCEIDLRRRTWMGRRARFDTQIRLDRRPFVSVTSIEYVAPITGVVTAVPSTVWHAVEIGQHQGMVFLGDGEQWPEHARRVDAVRITYQSGFADGAIPADIRQALLMTIAKLDHERGDCGGSGGGAADSVYAMKNHRAAFLPDAAQALLAPWRLMRLRIA